MERLEKIGQIKPKHSTEIENSRFGIGFEKLDRDVFDPEKAYDKVAAIGIKWIRLQSGWARTEKEKGVYDFTWLDSVVDNLISRGMIPWLCLCYGNSLYDEAAAQVFGAVGCPPIHTEEQKTAWANYVKATVKHFKGRIEYYEVWNEPDGQWCWKHGPNGTELGIFTAVTGKIIKNTDPNAKVIGGSLCRRDLDFLNKALSAGMSEVIDAVTFHEYTPREEYVYERAEALKALVKQYNPNIEIIQGESGSQSRSDGAGALRGGAWTQKKQAKQLLRHALADIKSKVKFSSYFSCMDMIEALNGSVNDLSSYLDYGYFGVLGADFDEKGYSTGEYTPKMSYYAYQTIASLLCNDYKIVDMPILFRPESSLRLQGNEPDRFSFECLGIEKPNKSHAFFYWYKSDIMTTDYEGTITMQVCGLGNDIRLVDTMDGSVYKLPDSMIEDLGDGCYTLKNIPTKDYPLALLFGDFE